jgi:hypothetical protein
MHQASELYERVALCHERAVNSLKQAEQKRWFELASIWLILADNASTRRESAPLKEPVELSIEEMLRLLFVVRAQSAT